MNLTTPWGYTVDDDDAFKALLSMNDFAELTAGKYSGDVRAAETINAASTAIRNYCGWHIFPISDCSFSERLLSGNGRVKRAGTDILIQLPATFVSAVSEVKIDDEESHDFDFETNGLLRIFDVYCHQVTRKTKITVKYTAGIPENLMSGVKELTAGRVIHSLASPNGVSSESAGGVSVTYNASWINSAAAGAMSEADKEILEPYRLKGVF